MMSDLKNSVRATYDSAETGPRYTVTTFVNDQVVGEFRQPIADPFVRQTVYVGLGAAVRSFLRCRRLKVEVIVGGDIELMNDVLELDDQTLIRGRTRHAAFQQAMHQHLRAFGDEVTR